MIKGSTSNRTLRKIDPLSHTQGQGVRGNVGTWSGIETITVGIPFIFR